MLPSKFRLSTSGLIFIYGCKAIAIALLIIAVTEEFKHHTTLALYLVLAGIIFFIIPRIFGGLFFAINLLISKLCQPLRKKR